MLFPALHIHDHNDCPVRTRNMGKSLLSLIDPHTGRGSVDELWALLFLGPFSYWGRPRPSTLNDEAASLEVLQGH